MEQSINKLLNNFGEVFHDILGKVSLKSIGDNNIIFSNEGKEMIVGKVIGNSVHFCYTNGTIDKYIFLKLPSYDKENINVLEIIKENRDKGCVIEKIDKKYNYSIYSNNKRTLLDLVSTRYVFDKKEIDIKPIFDDLIINKNSSYLSENCLISSKFECHMKYFFMEYGHRYLTDSPYSTKTLVNGNDFSSIYDIVNGYDKVSRIYDLYKGVINERNSNDIIAINKGLLKKGAFSLKEDLGINIDENKICGGFAGDKSYNPYNLDYNFIDNLIFNKIGYNKEFNYNDVNSLLEAITYQNYLEKNTKEIIESELGMSYDSFIKLDCDEQDKIIQNHKLNIKKDSTDEERVMIGEGEHAIFTKVKRERRIMIGSGEHSIFIKAGVTPDESRNELNQRLDEIVNKKESENKQKKGKILRLFKRKNKGV